MDDGTKKVLGIAGLAGVGLLAYRYFIKKSDTPPPPSDKALLIIGVTGLPAGTAVSISLNRTVIGTAAVGNPLEYTMEPGTGLVTFEDVPGYMPPGQQNITAEAGKSINVIGVYVTTSFACPEGYDCTLWSQAILQCPGCSRTVTESMYWTLYGEINPLTPEQVAELDRLRQASLSSAGTMFELDSLKYKEQYWTFYGSLRPGDPSIAAELAKAVAAYNAAVQNAVTYWDTIINQRTGELEAAYAALGTGVIGNLSVPRTGLWGQYCNSADITIALSNWINYRKNETTTQATVWTGTNESGTSADLVLGEYPQLPDIGIPNNSLECMLLYPGVKLTCYWNNDFGGGMACVLDAAATDAALIAEGVFDTEVIFTNFITIGDPPLPYKIADSEVAFNLPSAWRNEIGSIKCELSLTLYEQRLAVLAQDLINQWVYIGDKKNTILTISETLQLWINDRDIMQLQLATFNMLVNRTNAIMAVVSTMMPVA